MAACTSSILLCPQRHRITRNDVERGLTEQQWDAAIESGLSFSAEVCRSLYNYVSPEFGAARQKELI